VYFRYFCGEEYFQACLPCSPTNLVRFRQALGEAGVEELLAATIGAAVQMKAVKSSEFERVIVDTTVQEKAVAYPTDSRLLEAARAKIVMLAQRAGLTLKQTFAREGKQLRRRAGGYAHAKQFRRLRRVLKRQRTVLGRVLRDIERKMGALAQIQQEELQVWLARAWRICRQRPKDKNKLYALHAPEVECIGKGKARQPYEFGVKVSLAITARQGLIVGARSFPGNPFDGHTLAARSSKLRSCYKTCQARQSRAPPSPISDFVAWMRRWHRCRSSIAAKPGHSMQSSADGSNAVRQSSPSSATPRRITACVDAG